MNEKLDKSEMEKVINKLKDADTSADMSLEVCGSWLWIDGETYKHKDVLRQAGCKWAVKKRMWYWKPANYSRPWFKSSREYSLDDIRNEHGSLRVG